jgi:hypothetical protein
MNDPVKAPLETKQVGAGDEATTAPVKVQAVSAPTKPLPVTVTVTPGWPDERLNVIVAVLVVTMKVAEAESPVGVPTAVIV